MIYYFPRFYDLRVELDFGSVMFTYCPIKYYLISIANNYTPIHIANTSTIDGTFDQCGLHLYVLISVLFFDKFGMSLYSPPKIALKPPQPPRTNSPPLCYSYCGHSKHYFTVVLIFTFFFNLESWLGYLNMILLV